MSNKTAEVKKSNKGYLIAGSVILVAIIFVVCFGLFGGKDNTPTDDATKIDFALKVTYDAEELLYDETISVEEGTTLMDAMKENVEVVEADGFITSICGKEQNADESRYWVYTVNGESIMVGASDYIIEEGDEVVFDLSVLTW